MTKFNVGDRVLIDTWTRKDVPGKIISYEYVEGDYLYRVILDEDGTHYNRTDRRITPNQMPYVVAALVAI